MHTGLLIRCPRHEAVRRSRQFLQQLPVDAPGIDCTTPFVARVCHDVRIQPKRLGHCLCGRLWDNMRLPSTREKHSARFSSLTTLSCDLVHGRREVQYWEILQTLGERLICATRNGEWAETDATGRFDGRQHAMLFNVVIDLECSNFDFVTSECPKEVTRLISDLKDHGYKAFVTDRGGREIDDETLSALVEAIDREIR